jgi:hypothetical protein
MTLLSLLNFLTRCIVRGITIQQYKQNKKEDKMNLNVVIEYIECAIRDEWSHETSIDFVEKIDGLKDRYNLFAKTREDEFAEALGIEPVQFDRFDKTAIDKSEWVRVAEAAENAKTTPSTIRKRIQTGWDSVLIDGIIHVRNEDVANFKFETATVPRPRKSKNPTKAQVEQRKLEALKIINRPMKLADAADLLFKIADYSNVSSNSRAQKAAADTIRMLVTHGHIGWENTSGRNAKRPTNDDTVFPIGWQSELEPVSRKVWFR